MQENHLPEQSLAVLDAEMTLGEADAKMRALFREFRPQKHTQLFYDYTDEKDEHQIVALLSDSGIDTNRAEFIVRTKNESFLLAVSRTTESANALHTDTHVRYLNDKSKEFVDANEEQQLRLAEVLSHLDVDLVRKETRQRIAKEKAEKTSWLGRLTHRSVY